MKKIHICDYCNLNFDSSKKLYEHKRVVHNVSKGSRQKFFLICPFCLKEFFTYRNSLSFHKKYCNSNPNREIYKSRQVRQEVKDKISKSMKIAAEEGRNRGWATTKTYECNKSYPEMWFTKVIENEIEDKDYIYNMPFFRYKLDFAWPKKKLCIEIDGSQHLKEDRLASDKRKDTKLIENGWKVLRLTWLYCFNCSKEAIEASKKFIDSEEIINIDQTIYDKKYKKNILRKRAIESDQIDSLGKMNRRILLKNEIEKRSNLILNSNIDFTKFGWLTKVSKILNFSSQCTARFMKKYMSDFYENCYKTNSKKSY